MVLVKDRNEFLYRAGFGQIATKTKLTFSFAKALVISLPIPPVAPAITTTLFLRSILQSYSFTSFFAIKFLVEVFNESRLNFVNSGADYFFLHTFNIYNSLHSRRCPMPHF